MTKRMTTPSPNPFVSQNLLLFAALCVVWGLIWIPSKIGTAAVPPSLFAATCFLAAGMVLAIIAQSPKHPLPQRRAIPNPL